MKPRTAYGTVSSLFWDSDTGWQLQSAGSDALILSLYLASNRHANMLGLYRLPRDQIGRELKVIPRDALLPAFGILERLDVAFYDRESEFVWVLEMAGQRLHPTAPEQTLAPEDGKRWIAVQRAYAELPANPFLGAFFDHYQRRLRLLNRRPGSGHFEKGRYGIPYGIPYGMGYRMATTEDQITEDQGTEDQLNRRVETVDAVGKPGFTPPSEPSVHSSHTPMPAPERRPTLSPDKTHEDREPLLPLGRMQLVPDPVRAMAADLEEAIADLVLTQLRLLQRWQSRDELTDAALELCSKTPGLTRVRRPLVEAGIDRAFRDAHERGLAFASAPGARLMDTTHEKQDTG